MAYDITFTGFEDKAFNKLETDEQRTPRKFEFNKSSGHPYHGMVGGRKCKVWYPTCDPENHLIETDWIPVR